MTTKKNNKVVVNNVRDLGQAIEAAKPSVSMLTNSLLEAFASEYGDMEQLTAAKAELSFLENDLFEAEKKVAPWARFVFETEKTICRTRQAALDAIKESRELRELSAYLTRTGKQDQWAKTQEEYVSAYVVEVVGTENIEKLAQIKRDTPALQAQIGALKAAITAQKELIAKFG